jgi:hypothetical protein
LYPHFLFLILCVFTRGILPSLAAMLFCIMLCRLSGTRTCHDFSTIFGRAKSNIGSFSMCLSLFLFRNWSKVI